MNKYKAIKINGKVEQGHRLKMELHLGRKLSNQEIVHHIDGDKSNNSINNLLLFLTKAAHTKYHFDNGDLKLKAGSNRKKLINGKLKCIKCKNYKELKEFAKDPTKYLGVKGICKKCYNLQRRKKKQSSEL